ncbi:hypothetical protein FRB99_008803, partial [Tulasnella sp. 403]
MLPAPATSLYGRRNNSYPDPFSNFSFNRAFLLSRSRLTNLGVITLGATLLVSLLFNFNSFLTHSNLPLKEDGDLLVREAARMPHSIVDTVARDPDLTALTHLVIVAGHAVWTGCTPDGREDEANWMLEERQKGGGNVQAFFKHIETGARILHGDENSLLVFSGGQTRPKSLMTEAQSYHQLAVAAHLLESPGESKNSRVAKRAVSENFALDSFQNLLFSLARFREATGAYPKNITIIGFGMKRRRFEELHKVAIRWPQERFSYVGIDVDGDTSYAYAGEFQYGYTPYSNDLYGCHGELLEK